MAKHSVVHVQHSYDRHTGNDLDLNEQDVRRLSARIVEQAVADWIYLIHVEELTVKNPDRVPNYKNARSGNSNFTEIRNFFRSDYGATLCDIIHIAPEAILRKLEEWLTEYRKTGALPKYIFRVLDE